MKVLLDTHVILWALRDPDRLTSVAREVIVDRGTELVCSAASAWEIATKYRLGRLPGSEGLVAGYSDHLQRLGAIELPVSSRHGLIAGRLEWTHGDPFDRMLGAQSILEGLPLVTGDPALTTLSGVTVLW
jgi:Uncharacterized protein conserved in bacteria